jgi:hypothetical protein
MAVPTREAPSTPGIQLEGPAPKPRVVHLDSKAWDPARLAAGVLLITGIIGLLVTVGADGRWLAALGATIWAHGSIPAGVPFAWAPTAHWANSLVLAELIFHGLEAGLGDRGLVLANLIAVGACFATVALDARADGARSGSVVTAMALAALGALPSLGVARVQMFSLVLFPLLIALLRAEARRPSRRIWLALPLLALWSNLHGAALAGVAVLYAYLALRRFREEPLMAVAIAFGALVALCVTPAGISTVDYYQGLLSNVAAARGAGQWAPLGANPFDLVLIACGLLLAVRMRRCRPALWELAVMLGLAALTVKAARDGVWLLLFMVAPASHTAAARRHWNGLVAPGLALGVVLVILAAAQPPKRSGASPQMVARAVALAHGTSILADGLPAEQVALAGGKIWAGNPLDAFSERVQTAYVDWISGDTGGRSALSAPIVHVVLVTAGSDAEHLTAADPAYREVASDASAAIFTRTPARGADR